MLVIPWLQLAIVGVLVIPWLQLAIVGMLVPVVAGAMAWAGIRQAPQVTRCST